MLQKRDLELIRLAVRRRWITAEQGEDCLFLKRRFGAKYTIEEIIRRRGYLDDEALHDLGETVAKILARRPGTGIFKKPAAAAKPVAAKLAPERPRFASDDRERTVVTRAEAPAPSPPARPRYSSVNDEKTAIAIVAPLLDREPEPEPQEDTGRQPAFESDDEVTDSQVRVLADPAISSASTESIERTSPGVVLGRVPAPPGPGLDSLDTVGPIDAPEIEPRSASNAGVTDPRVVLGGLPRVEVTAPIGDAVTQEHAEELELGPTFGPYSVLRLIARGATGTVYLARRSDGGIPIALKVLRAELGRSEEFVQRFHREARAAASIDSPNVVRILDVGTVDGRHYLAMEYVDGWTLTERLESGEGPSPIEALEIARDIASALAKAADRGIVHRDVKPDNVMIARDGRVLLTDFGLAKDLEPVKESISITKDVIVGTPNYIAPEQALGHAIDARADLYALGATLFHLLAGRPVFTGRSSVSIIAKHVREPAPDLAVVAPGIPAAAAKVVRRLLEKQPALRYASAAETRQAIEAAIAELVEAEKVGPSKQEAELDARRGVLQRALVVALFMVAISLAAPWVLERLGLIEWRRQEALLRSALIGAIGIGVSMILLATIGLVRRGELPLPGSTAWMVSVKEAASAIGAAALVAGSVLGPPALINLVVAAVAMLAMASAVYGILLRRYIARSRPDRGVGHVLAVLSDPRLSGWRRLHVPVIVTLASIATVRFALLAYFRA